MNAIRPSGRLAAVSVALLLAAACSDDPTTPETPPVVAPQITAQPQDATANAGATATFSVTATGTAPLVYQWERDGVAIADATASSYVLDPVAVADGAAQFSVVVSNDAGSVESRAAGITVRTAPAIVSQPENVTALSGVPAGFSVEATGADLEFQWLRGGEPIAGATGSTYHVGVPLAGDDGAVYSVRVSNDLGSVTSTEASLQVQLDVAPRPTSYANAKALNQAHDEVPEEVRVWTAKAFGDFFGDGNRDLFVATSLYDHSLPASEAVPGEFQFWCWTPGGYVRDGALLADETGCIHPRAAVAADFNRDGRLDIFVACHGYDADPFPGEPSYVVMSQPGGTYDVRQVGDAGFYHGATAVDVDADTDIDVVVADSHGQNPIYTFVNDGSGGFTVRSDLFPHPGASYFTVEAVDVNGDGLPDLLAGGHDWEGAPTLVMINDGSGSFANVTPVHLPAVPNEGVVLDFTVLDADRDGVNEIYVARTSGGDGTFYQSRTVQRILWPGFESEVLLNERPAAAAYYLIPLFDGAAYSLALITPDEAANHRLVLP